MGRRQMPGAIRKKLTYTIKVQGERKRRTSLFKTGHNKANCSRLPYTELSCEAEPHESSSFEKDITYQTKRARLSEGWRLLEGKLLNIAMATYRPENHCCVRCLKHVENIIRCSDCGPNMLYCPECYDNAHAHVWFHVPDIWQGDLFVKMVLRTRLLQRVEKCHCQTEYTRFLVLVDYKGIQHRTECQFCACESEPETLLRYNLWPCSPTNPKVAVSTFLLEWIRVLFLEKQISIEGFCNAMEQRFVKSPGYEIYIKDLSRILLCETLESYRHHIYQLQHSSSLHCDGLDDGTVCLACKENPESEETYCLDANFGLVRRAASGYQSYRPHHSNKFFVKQDEVDSFIENYDDRNASNQECSDFQAGSKVRSKGKNLKLDIKGIFGACCRHEFPKLFLDLKYGERLGYPVYIIKKLLEMKRPLKIFYDIACKLKDHLKLRKITSMDILNNVVFAVPVFHGYGHKMACQKTYSPRRLSGFGLTEGETMERLWSYLRNFNKITKEMKPEHRTDVLTDALIHYGARLKCRVGRHLNQKLQKAESTHQNANDELGVLMTSYPGGITLEEIGLLDYQNDPVVGISALTWEEEYSLKINDINTLRQALYVLEASSGEPDGESIAETAGKIARCVL